MKFKIALILGKILYLIGKPFGKSTNLPGEIALKICPSLFSQFKFSGKVLAVTGSNGKTTTANTVAHILSECGYCVINNAKGSNLTGGVATTLITNSNFSGNVSADFVVLEVDEMKKMRYNAFWRVFYATEKEYVFILCFATRYSDVFSSEKNCRQR